jgi:homoserine kinase
MPHTHQLVARLRAAGVAAVVSGAGPSVLAFLDREPGRDERKSMDSIAEETGIEWHISPLAIERQGASVVPGDSPAR